MAAKKSRGHSAPRPRAAPAAAARVDGHGTTRRSTASVPKPWHSPDAGRRAQAGIVERKPMRCFGAKTEMAAAVLFLAFEAAHP
jgi:hypothetical protein